MIDDKRVNDQYQSHPKDGIIRSILRDWRTWFIASVIITFGVVNFIPLLKHVTIWTWSKNILERVSISGSTAQSALESFPLQSAGMVVILLLMVLWVGKRLWRNLKKMQFDDIPFIVIMVSVVVCSIVVAAQMIGMLPISFLQALEIILFFFTLAIVMFLAAIVIKGVKENLKMEDIAIVAALLFFVNLLVFFAGHYGYGPKPTFVNIFTGVQISAAILLFSGYMSARARRVSRGAVTTHTGAIDDGVDFGEVEAVDSDD
jgi:membrane-associated HD superfamily phosphohydrolase